MQPNKCLPNCKPCRASKQDTLRPRPVLRPVRGPTPAGVRSSPMAQTHSSLLLNPHLPAMASRGGACTCRRLAAACLPCMIALALREPAGDASARPAFVLRCSNGDSTCVDPTRSNAALPHPVVSEHLMIWALPDLKVASSCGTGALATIPVAVSVCFAVHMHASGVWTPLTSCCRTSRPGSNECCWNLLQAACVLHYPLNFLSAAEPGQS